MSGIAWGARSLRLTGALELIGEGGRTLIDASVGTWTVRYNGTGAMSVTPPAGSDKPLSVRLLDSPNEISAGEAAWLTVALSRPARVVPVTAGGDTPTDPLRDAGTVQNAGRRRVPWLAPLEPGRYEVHVEASSGLSTKRTEPVEISVTERTDSEAPTSERGVETASGDPDEPAAPWGLLLIALVFAAAGVFAVKVTMKR